MKPSLIEKNNSFFPYFLLIIQPIFMASNLAIAKGAVSFVPPVSLGFWRWTTVFILLIPFFYKPILENIKYFKSEFLKLFFLGFTGCCICSIFPYVAGQTTTVLNMSLIYTSSSIFIVLISAFFYKEKINLLQSLGFLFAFVGVLVVISNGKLSVLLNLEFVEGDIWILGAAISWALYSVYVLHWKSKFNFFTKFTLIAFFGSLSLFPFYLYETFYLGDKLTLDFISIFWIFLAAISPGIVAFALYSKIQKYLGASITGFTLYLFVVYGAFYGIFFFNEKLYMSHYFGGALVLLGVYFAKKT
tara:strand:+ start:35 stop:940 length:906 start_codon:yes stop_codon:yes gene_type:complete